MTLDKDRYYEIFKISFIFFFLVCTFWFLFWSQNRLMLKIRISQLPKIERPKYLARLTSVGKQSQSYDIQWEWLSLHRRMVCVIILFDITTRANMTFHRSTGWKWSLYRTHSNKRYFFTTSFHIFSLEKQFINEVNALN